MLVPTLELGYSVHGFHYDNSLPALQRGSGWVRFCFPTHPNSPKTIRREGGKNQTQNHFHLTEHERLVDLNPALLTSTPVFWRDLTNRERILKKPHCRNATSKSKQYYTNRKRRGREGERQGVRELFVISPVKEQDFTGALKSEDLIRKREKER